MIYFYYLLIIDTSNEYFKVFLDWFPRFYYWLLVDLSLVGMNAQMMLQDFVLEGLQTLVQNWALGDLTLAGMNAQMMLRDLDLEWVQTLVMKGALGEKGFLAGIEVFGGRVVKESYSGVQACTSDEVLVLAGTEVRRTGIGVADVAGVAGVGADEAIHMPPVRTDALDFVAPPSFFF